MSQIWVVFETVEWIQVWHAHFFRHLSGSRVDRVLGSHLTRQDEDNFLVQDGQLKKPIRSDIITKHHFY